MNSTASRCFENPNVMLRTDKGLRPCYGYGRNNSKKQHMIPKHAPALNILVVEEAQEMRDGIEALLQRDGYWVTLARDEEEAVAKVHTKSPDLILVSLTGPTELILAASRRIRTRGGLTEDTPVVIFSITNFPEGLEMHIGGNIFITAPDNFDQLRTLVMRVLRER
jgi:CheY-like chemotaxis protein